MTRFRPEDFPAGSRLRRQIDEAMAKPSRSAEDALGVDKPKRSRKIVNRPEEDLQKELIRTADKWPMRMLLAHDAGYPDDVRNTNLGWWLYHIPNQRGDKVQRMILASMGVKAGVWDLFCMIPNGRNPGLYLELKADDNDLSEAQYKFGQRALMLGFACEEVRGGVEFSSAIERYFDGAINQYPDLRGMEL